MARPTSSSSTSNHSKGVIGWNVAPEQAQFDNSPLAASNHPRLLNRGPISASGPRFTSMNNIKRTAGEAFSLAMEDDSALAEEGGDEGDSMGDSDEEDEPSAGGPATGAGGKKKNPRKRNATSTGRRKIAISYIPDKSKRHVSFTKRKAGLMKKGFELSTLTGTDVLILVVSETGVVYTYATPGLKPVVDHSRGKQVVADSLRGELGPETDEDAGQGGPPLKRTQRQQQSNEESAHQPSATMDVDMEQVFGSASEQQQAHEAHLGLLSLPSHYDPSLFAPQASGSGASSSLSPFPSPGAVNTLPNPSQQTHQLPHIGDQLASHSFPAFPPMPSPSLTSAAQQQQPHPSAIPALSSFEQAQLSHQQAFQQYHASLTQEMIPLPAPPAHSQPPPPPHQSAPAPAPPPPVLSRSSSQVITPLVAPGRDTTLRNGYTALQRIMTDSLAGLAMGGLEAAYQDEVEGFAQLTKVAREALASARTKPTIQAYLKAYSAQLQAKGNKNDTTLRAERMIAVLAEYAYRMEVNSVDQLEEAVAEFLENVVEEKRSAQARQALMMLFDFLEQEDAISEDELDRLALFRPAKKNAAPKSAYSYTSGGGGEQADTVDRTSSSNRPGPREDPTSNSAASRAGRIEALLSAWSTRSVEKHKDRIARADPCGVRGWFEVYRLRKGFALLREREGEGPGLTGDPVINALLSPFKVRFTPGITRELRRGDALQLGLKQLTDESWIPKEFEAFEPTREGAQEEEVESEVDVEREEAELEILQGTGAARKWVERQRGKVEFLRKVREALEKGGGEEEDE